MLGLTAGIAGGVVLVQFLRTLHAVAAAFNGVGMGTFRFAAGVAGIGMAMITIQGNLIIANIILTHIRAGTIPIIANLYIVIGMVVRPTRVNTITLVRHIIRRRIQLGPTAVLTVLVTVKRMRIAMAALQRTPLVNVAVRGVIGTSQHIAVIRKVMRMLFLAALVAAACAMRMQLRHATDQRAALAVGEAGTGSNLNLGRLDVAVALIVRILAPEHHSNRGGGLSLPQRNVGSIPSGHGLCHFHHGSAIQAPAQEDVAGTHGRTHVADGRAVTGVDGLHAVTAAQGEVHQVVVAVVLDLNHGAAVSGNLGLGIQQVVEAGIALGHVRIGAFGNEAAGQRLLGFHILPRVVVIVHVLLQMNDGVVNQRRLVDDVEHTIRINTGDIQVILSGRQVVVFLVCLIALNRREDDLCIQRGTGSHSSLPGLPGNRPILVQEVDHHGVGVAIRSIVISHDGNITGAVRGHHRLHGRGISLILDADHGSLADSLAVSGDPADLGSAIQGIQGADLGVGDVHAGASLARNVNPGFAEERLPLAVAGTDGQRQLAGLGHGQLHLPCRIGQGFVAGFAVGGMIHRHKGGAFLVAAAHFAQVDGTQTDEQQVGEAGNGEGDGAVFLDHRGTQDLQFLIVAIDMDMVQDDVIAGLTQAIRIDGDLDGTRRLPRLLFIIAIVGKQSNAVDLVGIQRILDLLVNQQMIGIRNLLGIAIYIARELTGDLNTILLNATKGVVVIVRMPGTINIVIERTGSNQRSFAQTDDIQLNMLRLVVRHKRIIPSTFFLVHINQIVIAFSRGSHLSEHVDEATAFVRAVHQQHSGEAVNAEAQLAILDGVQAQLLGGSDAVFLVDVVDQNLVAVLTQLIRGYGHGNRFTAAGLPNGIAVHQRDVKRNNGSSNAGQARQMLGSFADGGFRQLHGHAVRNVTGNSHAGATHGFDNLAGFLFGTG